MPKTLLTNGDFPLHNLRVETGALEEWSDLHELVDAATLCARRSDPAARPVRAVWFVKPPHGDAGRSWAVGWHQDRVVALKARADAPGFSKWSEKSGILHAEAPEKVLQTMRFALVHVDDATRESGALEVVDASAIVPAEGIVSHTAGRLSGMCEARAGDIVLLPMLCLHRSGPNTSDQVRRILRVDFAHQALPAPLEWATLDAASGSA